MPYRNEFVEPECIVTYKGVSVYRTYKHDDIEQPRRCWFTTNYDYQDTGPGSFDVRELKGYKEGDEDDWKKLKALFKSAIKSGEIKKDSEVS